jgi:ADP-heptose:LPS heptosyltransferase
LIPWYYYPQIELAKLRGTDFFPPPPDLNQLHRICLGSKTRTIGDAMMLSTLPEKIKEAHPHIKISIYPRGFNPVVFWNNPFVDGIDYVPGRLYGDDCSEGKGHIIQLKERYFELPVSEDPAPKLYLTEQEKEWARNFISSRSSTERSKLPLLIVHPFGHTWGKVMSKELWEKCVESWKATHRVWQIGIEGHPMIEGCDFHFLTPKKRSFARQLFSVMSHSQAFIGVNSGPMHIAKAFGLRSLVLIEEGSPEKIFENRHKYPYFLNRNWAKGFLYESLPHLNVPDYSPEALAEGLDRFVLGQSLV